MHWRNFLPHNCRELKCEKEMASSGSSFETRIWHKENYFLFFLFVFLVYFTLIDKLSDSTNIIYKLEIEYYFSLKWDWWSENALTSFCQMNHKLLNVLSSSMFILFQLIKRSFFLFFFFLLKQEKRFTFYLWQVELYDLEYSSVGKEVKMLVTILLWGMLKIQECFALNF